MYGMNIHVSVGAGRYPEVSAVGYNGAYGDG